MNKRNAVVLAALIMISLIGAAYVLFSKPKAEESVKQDAVVQLAEEKEQPPVDSKTDNTEDNDNNNNLLEENKEQPEKEEIQSIEIKVANNSPEFDMKASLCRKGSGEAFIRLEYYNEGASVEKQLSSEMVPEIKGVVENNGKANPDKHEYRLDSVLLNPRNQKVYFLITGKAMGEEVETALYTYNLTDSTAKKLLSQIGRFSELKFSKDLKYLALSFYDSPLSSVYQEKSLLQILDCTGDSFVVNGSRDAKGQLIGKNTDIKQIYDYIMLNWHSNGVIKLKEVTYAKSGQVNEKAREVLYDIGKNLLTNVDGTPAFAAENKDKKDTQQVKQDSEPVKTLKGFYALLSQGEFTKAYDILDDKFQFAAFKLMGVTELSKKDIDVESFAIYGSLFKSARIESIVQEDSDTASSTIYFYQLLTISEGNEAKQALVAKLRKTDKGWKVYSVSDGNTSEKPFKK